MKRSLFFLFLFLLGGVSAFAKVSVTEHAGTLVVTLPNGEIKLIDKGEALPDIPTQTKLEILDGNISATAEDGDSIVVACLRHEANLAGGVSGKVVCTPQLSQIEAVDGVIVIVDPNGKQITIDSKDPNNKIFKIEGEAPGGAKKKVPPTEAGGLPGSPASTGIAGEGTPVDSRDIESSPGQ